MATFRAHNVEYDNFDVDVDDTKELQIEDALKHYQTALKYHSEGARSFGEASRAYQQLFESEIFAYDEALSEFRRWETFPNYDQLLSQTFDLSTVALITDGDDASNTLPQILHLSYKNYGQLILEMLCHDAQNALLQPVEERQSHQADRQAACQPLSHFAEALDKDDSDLDLWRRSAKVATWAGSYRVARYCLESVLDGDNEGMQAIFDSPGIDETLAMHDLRRLAQDLHDQLSLLSEPFTTLKQSVLSPAVKKLFNSYPFLLPRPFNHAALSREGTTGKVPVLNLIRIESRDWSAVGAGILRQLTLEENGEADVGSGFGIAFEIPKSPGTMAHDADVVMTGVATNLQNVARLLPGTSPPKPAEELSILVDSAADPSLEHGDGTSEAKNDQVLVAINKAPRENETDPPTNQTPSSMPLMPDAPARKRSSESAGLTEAPDGPRSRSKRVRARWTTGGERIDTVSAEMLKENALNEQLDQYAQADDIMYNIIQPILARLEIPASVVPPSVIRDIIKQEDDDEMYSEYPIKVAIKDFFDAIKACDSATLDILTTDWFSAKAVSPTSRQAGLNVFLGHETMPRDKTTQKPALAPDLGLDAWIENITASWCISRTAAWEWLCALFRPYHVAGKESLYCSFTWSDHLKQTARNIAVLIDSHLYNQLSGQLEALEHIYLSSCAKKELLILNPHHRATIEMIQSIFELHIDIYATLKAGGTTVDTQVRLVERDRLDQWSRLSNLAVRLVHHFDDEASMDDLNIRQIWSQAEWLALEENVGQEFILACVRDLRSLMRTMGDRIIQLPNNDMMTEISAAAAESKLGRMNMKDLFVRLFSTELDDEENAVAVIEGLEPLLLLAETQTTRGKHGKSSDDNTDIDSSSDTFQSQEDAEVAPSSDSEHQVGYFISSASLTLRLALWQRLQDAYSVINFKPMAIFCDFRIITLLIEELKSTQHMTNTKNLRTSCLLSNIRLLDDLISRILTVRHDTPSYLDCLDSGQIKHLLEMIGQLCSILHASRLLVDQVTVGSTTTPGPSSKGHAAFSSLSSGLDDMLIRAWTLLYLLLSDAIEQYREKFPAPTEDRLSFLRAIHHITGTRGSCSASNKLFLKMARDELLQLSDLPDAIHELCQVLYDLYGLKCSHHSTDLVDHDCLDPETLSTKTALQILGFMMALADKYNIKDLPRAELKVALDKVQEVLGRPKSSHIVSSNRQICNMYIKNSIKPIDLFDCTKGTLALATKPMSPKEAPVSSTGWYFLLGNIALNKWRSQKRTGSIPTEDLDAAIVFFLDDLAYSSEQWGTWYRLAQCYDMQVDECVSWSAEKLNKNSNDIQNFQRQAMNCYSMAVSCVVRHGIGQESAKVSETVGQLYAEFGIRVYSSTREPFSMRAFEARESDGKIFNRVSAQGTIMYRAPAFKALKMVAGWRFAASLLHEAIRRCPGTWQYHYTLGKCMWKVYQASDEELGRACRPGIDEIVNAFCQAIQQLPKSRDSRKDPILEPHYKLVSIVNKLVGRGMSCSRAVKALQTTKYASKVEAPSEKQDGNAAWEEYILKVLKMLRNADKACWHHRMTVRAAGIIYAGGDYLSAMGAKHELMHQMFTKTMILQVWKPENERRGRHFVYTKRYVEFFVDILEKTNDRTSIDLLAKRLRKKVMDYCNHKELWQMVCLRYVRMLRAHGKVPPGHDEVVFKNINHEEFLQKASALERWCATKSESTIVDILRETVELKRLNAGYMKTVPLDDLITDTYSLMYQQVTPTLQLSDGVSASDEPETNGTLLTANNHTSNTCEVMVKLGGRARGVGRRELLKRAELAGLSTTGRAEKETMEYSRRITIQAADQPEDSVNGASVTASLAALDDDDGGESGLSLSELSELDELEDLDKLDSPLRSGLAQAQAQAQQRESRMEHGYHQDQDQMHGTEQLIEGEEAHDNESKEMEEGDAEQEEEGGFDAEDEYEEEERYGERLDGEQDDPDQVVYDAEEEEEDFDQELDPGLDGKQDHDMGYGI